MLSRSQALIKEESEQVRRAIVSTVGQQTRSETSLLSFGLQEGGPATDSPCFMATSLQLRSAVADVSWIVSKSFCTLFDLLLDIVSRMGLDERECANQSYRNRRNIHDETEVEETVVQLKVLRFCWR